MELSVFVELLERYDFGSIKNIHCFKSDVYHDNVFLFEKIIIETGQFLVFSPIEDTDEINVTIVDEFDVNSKNEILLYDKYNGQKILDIKQCINHMACFDQCSIAFNGFNPSFSIICELSLLGIFESNPIIW